MKETKKTDGRQPVRVCPICGDAYRAHPAISRKDNTTEICPDCGILEALAALGCPQEEQLHILDLVRSYSGRYSNEN